MIQPEQLCNGMEHGEQAALFCWAAHTINLEGAPQILRDALECMFAIPNGDQRGDGSKKGAAIAGGRLKAEGLRSGVPDIMMAWPLKVYWANAVDITCAGLFIEMKKPDLKRDDKPSHGCTTEQLDWHSKLSQAGYAVVVCYTWIEARNAILRYLGLQTA